MSLGSWIRGNIVLLLVQNQSLNWGMEGGKETEQKTWKVIPLL